MCSNCNNNRHMNIVPESLWAVLRRGQLNYKVHVFDFVTVLCPEWSVLGVVHSVVFGHCLSHGASLAMQQLALAVTWMLAALLLGETVKYHLMYWTAAKCVYRLSGICQTSGVGKQDCCNIIISHYWLLKRTFSMEMHFSCW